MNRYSVGSDGMTAHRRVRGRNFRREMLEIGEGVWYLEPKSVGINKMSSRWAIGMYLGVRVESNEVIIGIEQGVIIEGA